jgi:hypothetical protein
VPDEPGAAVDTSIFAFATDLADEGVETVLDNVQHRARLGGITLAAVYHQSRDVFPHDPVRRVRFLEGGVAYFRPDPSRYVELHPRRSALARERDLLAEVCEAAERRGLAVHAWTVFLHTDWTRDGDPAFAELNAFGDPMLTQLCPANPGVRAYVRGLAGDVARYGVRTVVAESLHYHPLEHGVEHERYFLQLGARTRFLLGLCFCHHCVATAHAEGVDGEALRAWAASEVQRVFDTGVDTAEAELTRAEAEQLAGGELGGLLRARERIVSSLVAEAAEAVADEGSTLSFLDASGATKGYATGRPHGGPAAEIAWRLGVDVGAIAEHATIEPLAYAADPERVRLDLDAYRALVPPGTRATVAAAMRPMLPDCDSAGNLAEKLRIASQAGAERVDLYHYGFVALPVLDRIAEAVELAR